MFGFCPAGSTSKVDLTFDWTRAVVQEYVSSRCQTNQMKYVFTLFAFVLCSIGIAQVPEYVPSEGLVAWYNLDGNGIDEATNQLHGSVQGAVSCQNRFGAESKAMEFDGVDDRVELPNNDAFNVGEVSVSLWFLAPSFEEFSQDQAELISKQIGTGWGSDLEVGVGLPFANSTGQVYSQHRLGGMNHRVLAFESSGVQPGVWHHLVYTHGFSEAKFYLNGTLIHSESSLGTFSSNSMPVWIGARPSGAHYFSGQIDELGLWNRILTAQEILGLYTTIPPTLGCTEANACNYDEDADIDDGSCYPCEIPASHCGSGTIWDEISQTCIVANPADINLDGCVQLGDLLDLLAAYGTCQEVGDDSGEEDGMSYCDSLFNVMPVELLGTYEGYNYYSVGDSITWFEGEAFAQCLSPDFHLASIHSAEEVTTVVDWTWNRQMPWHWLGLYQNFNSPSYSEPGGGWEWSDGTPMNYTNWAGPEPNNGDGKEHHGQMNHPNWGAGIWNDGMGDVYLMSALLKIPQAFEVSFD